MQSRHISMRGRSPPLCVEVKLSGGPSADTKKRLRIDGEPNEMLAVALLLLSLSSRVQHCSAQCTHAERPTTF